MDLGTTTLGRTDLIVTTAGLGCGGHSRLGTRYGKDFDHAVGIVRAAIDIGINFIDTATGYQTEPHVAQAIQDIDRADVVISSKSGVRTREGRLSAEQFEQRLEASLERLGTDYVDLYHLHGLDVEDYDYAATEIMPVLDRAIHRGQVRFAAVSEAFALDPNHTMLKRALQDDFFDVMMVGFNLLNPSARQSVLPATKAKGIGTLGMFAVRQALTRSEVLHRTIQELIASGRLDTSIFEELDLDPSEPLAFIGTPEEI
ncbi:MAG: aldo/keto reductase, partial [Planctomycetota bacterium]